MKPTEIKKLLAEEIEEKSSHNAFTKTICDGCGKDIEEGEPFIFIGASQKICDDCQRDIIEFLE